MNWSRNYDDHTIKTLVYVGFKMYCMANDKDYDAYDGDSDVGYDHNIIDNNIPKKAIVSRFWCELASRNGK